MTVSAEKHTAAQTMKRALIGCVLVLSVAFLGLAAGTFFGGRVMVQPGSGLAGPAEALMWGVLSALCLGVAAGVVARRVSQKTLKRSALITFGLAALLAIALGLRVMYLDAGEHRDVSSMGQATPARSGAPN